MRKKSAGLLLFVVLLVLWLPAVTRAEDAAAISAADAADWRLQLILPGGEVRESAFSVAFGGADDVEYMLADPYIPVRLLADAAGVPIGWYAGNVVTWGSSPLSLVFVSGRPDVFYVMDAGAPQYTAVYHREHFVSPRIIGGSFCLPLAMLDDLGMTYSLDAAAHSITVRVPGSVCGGVSPDSVWQAVQLQVTDMLQPQAVLLGAATTFFDDTQINRSQNIYLAADALHGSIIRPGEIFSFNTTVGPRTAARGYRQAVIFSGGRPVLGYGGGVCQVSTTLYQAVLAAGLPVVERYPHSLPVSYAAAGRDATVVWGAQDMRWRNDTDDALYLLCRLSYTDGAALEVEIWQGELPQIVPEIVSTE